MMVNSIPAKAESFLVGENMGSLVKRSYDVIAGNKIYSLVAGPYSGYLG